MSDIPTIPATHRVAIFTTLGQPYDIRTEHPLTPRPEDLAPGQCIVRIEYAGLCHSDLHVRNGEWGNLAPAPMTIPGHEGVGHVVAVGPQVDQVKIGDRVGLKWLANTCGSCEWCWRGEDACQLHDFYIIFSAFILCCYCYSLSQASRPWYYM
jgi:alcohol dehydrogenase, propanol-preferring